MIGEQMIGMVGIANRPSGYDDDFLDSLEPIWDLLALNVHAARAEVLIDQANLAQIELNRLNIEKTSLIESLLGAQEKQSYLTSLDLHDGPAQTLASASMFLSALHTEIGRAHSNSSHTVISYAVFCLKKKTLTLLLFLIL